MKNRVFVLVGVCVALALIPTVLFSQGLQPAPKNVNYTLAFNVNVPNATVYVDNKLIRSMKVTVPAGTHVIRATAPGYKEYILNQRVTSDMVINIELQPLTLPLTIRINVAGAAIYVDGAQIAGNVAQVMPGTHQIRVTAPGYFEYVTSVTVQAATVVTPQLTPGFTLSVTANVAGAAVTVNGAAKGQVPYGEMLPPGTYSVQVSAPGYMDYVTNVVLNNPVTIAAQLSLPKTTLTFIVPPAILDVDNKGAPTQIKIFLDGKLINPRKELAGIEITPGQHQLRVTSGSFQVVSGNYTFAQGVNYNIELVMELKISAGK
jgi:hypothetical protein